MDYNYAYSLFKQKDYEKAKKVFSRIGIIDDSFGQNTAYHLGICYLQTDEKIKARNLFKFASQLDHLKDIQEISHFNYAKLSFEIEEPPYDGDYNNAPAKKARFVRVHLLNKPMPKLLSWLGRNAAMNCNGSIQFHHIDDGAPIFTRSMPLRWSGTDEPISNQVLQNGRMVQIFDPAKYNAASTRNCFPGRRETIDIAARFDDEDECYGWSNENYLLGKGWRNEDWKLVKGRFLVTVTVDSAGEKVVGAFKLENSVGRKDFRLTKASEDDLRKLR